MRDPYEVDGSVDPEAPDPDDPESQAIEAMDEAGRMAMLAGFIGLILPPLGVLAIVQGIRSRSLGAPHALDPPGSAMGGIVLGVTGLLIGGLWIVGLTGLAFGVLF